jgi:predicted N-formylglutamate amidohydrolase
VPYRRDVEAFVREARAAGRRVLHVSSHSFTPALDGMERRADVGLLYDPSRAGERALCLRWQRAMRRPLREWVVRRNYPYLGRSDGLTSWLRKRFADDAYVGVELEVNQKHVGATGRFSPAMEHAIAAALCAAVASFA